MRKKISRLGPVCLLLVVSLAGCGKKDKDSGSERDEPADLIEDCRVLGECEIAPELDRTVATTLAEAAAFLYEGENPLQRDVEEGAIDPKRVAMIRGLVEDAAGEPLLGAKVSVVGHPELGWTYSRADGAFDLAVNGGGRLVLAYEKRGHLPMQRAVQPAWQRYESLPTVALAPRSEKSTSIYPGAGSLQIAEAERVEDEEGARRPLVLFEPGTKATAHLPDGDAKVLNSLSVRISEYPFEPPGEDGETFSRFSAGTPSTTGLSYSLAFSVDEAEELGAESVSFDKPVTLYTENFLELETGSEIPFGFYNRESGTWEQDEAMLVIEMLDEKDGRAEIDADGDGKAEDKDVLEDLGITSRELQTLASRYDTGQTLWRAEVTHFSEYQGDFPVVPPPTAVAPSVATPKIRPLATTSRRGLVRVESQAVSQTVSLLGTPYSLYYQSDRTASFGAAYNIEVPLIGDDVPEGMIGVHVVATIAGQRMKATFVPEENLSHTFEWDGKDAQGRLVQGQQRAKISVFYSYPGEIRVTKRNDAGWGTSTAKNGGLYSHLKQTFEVPVGTWDAGGYEMGGFGLDVLHAYDPTHHTLHFGTGGAKYAENVALVVDLPAQGQDLGVPDSIGISPDGSAFVTDEEGRLLRIAPDEAVTVIAGDGAQGPAANWNLTNPQAIAFKSNGAIWVSDFDAASVWEIAPDGKTRCIIGSERDDPVVEADFDSIEGIAFGPSEELYLVARPSVYRLRGQTLEHFAGGGDADGDDVGDGGPATEAFLDVPSGIAAAPDGTVYISERDGDRIRKVTPNGNIFTYVGTGERGFSGDGELAANAQIDQPRGLALGPDGTLYFSDRSNGRIRMVSPEGRIQTLAGGGEAKLEAGQLATSIGIELPDGIAVGRDGTIWSSAESGLYRIRPGTSDLKGGENLIPSKDGRTLFKFDARGKHMATIDAMTAVTLHEFTYDKKGLLKSIADRDGLVTKIERADGGQAQKVVGPFGHETVLETDGARLAKVTDPIKRTRTFEYDEESGLISEAIDAKGQSTEFAYDTNDRLIKVTDPTGYVETYNRSNVPGGHSVKVTTATDKTMEFLVESSGVQTQDHGIIGFDGETLIMSDNLMSQTLYSPDGTAHFTQLEADAYFGPQAVFASAMETRTPGGRVLRVEPWRFKLVDDIKNALSVVEWVDSVEVNGREYEAIYNRTNRTLTTVSPEGRTSVTEFDEWGRPVARSAPGLAQRSWTYNDLGQPEQTIVGTGNAARATSLTWGEDGFFTAVSNPLNQETIYARDLVGRVLDVTRPDGEHVASLWDDNDNVLSITPPGKDAHTFEYGDDDLLDRNAPPAIDGKAVGNVSFEYGEENELLVIHQDGDRSIEFSYDLAGRLEETRFGGVTLRNFFDSLGRITTASRTASPTVNRTFDGPLWTGDTWSGATQGSVKVTYDDNFWADSITVNGALTAHFAHDNDGLVTEARVLTNQLDVARDPGTGMITDTTMSDVSTSVDYNEFGETTSLGATTSAVTFDQNIIRDDLGRITQLSETIDDVMSESSFFYDELGQLVEYERDGDVFKYSYDANGNRLSYEADGMTVAEGTYDEQDRIQSYGDWTFMHTEHGDLVQRTNGIESLTLTYDELGNLLAADREGGPSPVAIDYTVDAMGRRVARITGEGDERFWVYQDALRPVGEVANGIFTQYVYANDSIGGAPDFMVRSGVAYRFVKDHIGSVRFVVNANTGAVQQELQYDPFGRVLLDSNPGFQPFGFAGGLYDWETGLVRFGARDYDSVVGRWTAKDVIGFAGRQENVYTYAGNDPVNFVDPDGRRALKATEKAFLRKYFGSTLDVNAIDIGTSLGDRSWSPYGNRISLSSGYFSGGTVDLSNPHAAATFAHEAMHVWQRQQGVWVTTSGFFLQVGYSLGVHDPYAYTPSASSWDMYLLFQDGNVEQQGQIVEDMVYADLTGGSVAPYSLIADYLNPKMCR